MSLPALVPTNHVLTSGTNSALTWTNALTLSTVNTSTLNASNLSVSTLATSSLLTASTLTTGRLNYSSIVGSSISSNTLTLSLVNASTQNTQIYQVATTDPTTSYTVIQASHVSTGTTNNALALNPSGGNVGVGTTAPTVKLQVTSVSGSAHNAIAWGTNDGTAMGALGTSQASYGSGALYVYQNGGTATPAVKISAGSSDPSYFNQSVASGGILGIGTTTPAATLDVNGTFKVIDNITMSLAKSLYLYYGSATNAAGLKTDADGTLQIFTGTSGVVNRITVQNNGYVNISNLTTNGTVVTTASIGQLAVSSDRRIKENIVYQSDTQQGLASILNLKPATYRLIGQQDVYLGFIAQDLEQDIPLAVDGKKYEWQWEVEDGKPKFDANGDIVYKLDADGNKIVRPRGVSDRAIIATQTLAIQELSKKLDATQQQLAAKSAALDALIAWAQTQGYSVGA